MSHQDTDCLTSSRPSHPGLARALGRLIPEATLAGIGFRETCTWTPRSLVDAALFWSCAFAVLAEPLKSAAGSAPIPSYQDIITKVVAEVLRHHPWMAGRWEGELMVLPNEHEMHIGMAVDTEDGLLVPVIRDVAGLTLNDVAATSRSLIERARAGTLAAADMQGAVFTITNLGAFGIDAFTPVINAPEAAILGLGAIRREAIVCDDDTIVARPQLTLNLTFDHRIVDGAPAARFLQSIANEISGSSSLRLAARAVAAGGSSPTRPPSRGC